MRLRLLKYSERLIFILIAFVFILIVLLGAGINMSDATGHMPSCLFMGGTSSVCKMNIFEHLAGWHQLFTVPQVSIMTLILSMIVGPGLLLLRNIVRPDDYNFLAKRFSAKKSRIGKIFDYLVNAFSSGILHPKIY